MLLVTYCLIGASCLLLTAEATGYDHIEVPNDGLARDRRLMVNHGKTWPKAIVPYSLDPNGVSHLPEYKRIMSFVEDNSCVRFTPWDKGTSSRFGLGHPGHIRFYVGTGCHSFTVGVNKNPHGVRVSCCSNIPCLHEVGHALGFFHEQSNPRRDGWIRINQQNIDPSKQKNLYTKHAKGVNTSFPFDISSIMHYQAWMGSSGGPTFTGLFPELTVGHQYFYFFKEIAAGYRCHEKPQCKGKVLSCENDGYQTVSHGKCACKCPPGLDPGNLCKTVLTKVTSASWPKGQYALPKPTSGCASGDVFTDGLLKYHGPGGNPMPKHNHLEGVVDRKTTELHFCTKTTKDEVYDTPEGSKFNWPHGNYCIYQKGNTCPEGFVGRSIHHNSTDTTTTSGQLPDGVYSNEIELKICCSWRGFNDDPMSFPTDTPFYLFKHPDNPCQAVEGMRYTEETFTLTSAKKMTYDSPLFKWRTQHNKALTVHVCYYSRLDMDCGGIITLSKDNPETTIEMSGHGRKDLRCTWVVKGDTDKGTLVLDFEEFNLKKNGASCRDKVEVRHSRIGQWGTAYKPYECFPAQKQLKSIRSIYDKMMIRFFTIGNSQSSFKAKIRWVANEDMCYSVEHRGAHYDGNVNYTRSFLPCLPWAEMTHCPHHPFVDGDSQANLDGNACRNPDHSFRPWCYTDKTGCAREYCDVCGLENPFDRLDYCDKLRKEGFCTREASQAVKYCAKTCVDLLPTKNTMKTSKYQSCGRPVPPSDSTVVGTLRSSYKVGDTVHYKCKTLSGVAISTCLTSGRWSQVGSSCLPCPTGQVFYSGSNKCYALTGDGKTLTYDAGVASCKRGGGVMAVPRSLEEAGVIKQVAGNHFPLWIDITDKETEGTFKYQNGKPLIWNHWDRSEPNNHGKQGEDCAAMRLNTKWIDVPCSQKHPVVCAFATQDPSLCLDILGDKCASLVTERPSMCVDHSAFATHYCRKTCGVCKTTNTQCPVKNPDPSVLTLAEGKSTISVGEYVNYECDRFMYRVKGHVSRACLTDGTLSGEPLECGECPVGFKLMNQACHGVLVSTEMATFSDSKLACKKLDGFLAMPKTQAENTYINSLGHGQQVRLGLTDQYTNTFVWQDGTAINWNHWAAGYPQMANNRQHCAVMKGAGLWMNVLCNANHADMVTVCTIPKTDDDVCYDTKDGGISYDGRANYTQAHQPCVPWTEVMNCPHHAFKDGDQMDSLEENYCRNPDNSYRPWCYTDKNGCKRDFCDVCGTGLQHDRVENCQTLKSQGVCVMEPDRALKDCAATCRDDLTIKTPAVKKFRDIRCGPPLPPSDGVVVGQVKNEYKLGETVQFKCKTDPWSVYSRCMTSGQWSDAGLACLQSDCVGTILDNTCYHVLDNGHHYNYDDAVTRCAARKAVVATPRSQREANFIRNLAKSKIVMLGINDKKEEGTWVYQDETKLSWSNWRRSEPNNSGKDGEDCAYMNGYTKWVDTACVYKHVVVCAAPRKKMSSCNDYLVSKCPRLLAQSPNMCQQHNGFATVFCTKTCGLCHT